MSVRAFMEAHGLKEDDEMNVNADPNCPECNGTGLGPLDAQGNATHCACVRRKGIVTEDDAPPQRREDDTPEIIAQKRKWLEQIGITDEEVEAGTEFHAEADCADPRFQRITIRAPRVVNLDDVQLYGADAQWRTIKYFLASAKGAIDMLAATLPLKVVSGLAMHGVSYALEQIAIVVAAVDEQRRERKSKEH